MLTENNVSRERPVTLIHHAANCDHEMPPIHFLHLEDVFQPARPSLKLTSSPWQTAVLRSCMTQTWRKTPKAGAMPHK